MDKDYNKIPRVKAPWYGTALGVFLLATGAFAIIGGGMYVLF